MPNHQQTASPNGHPASSRTLRLSLVLLLLVSLVPLGFGIRATMSQQRIADLADIGSAVSRRLLDALPGFHRSRELQAPAASTANTTSLPPVQTDVPGNAEVTQTGQVTYGDRLKISFFESLGVTLDGSGSAAGQSVATVFPRMDISGEYTVDEGGAINLPRLGQFTAAGQTIQGLQAALAAKFKRALGRTSDVQVAIASREPVYITGKVRTAGALKYTPGMIVLQAMANAGGTDSAVADTSKDIERIRETERLHQAEDRLDQLRVKQAGLIALRDSADGLELPAGIRSRLDDKRLQDMLTRATATLSLERKGRRQGLELAKRRVSIAELEVQSQQFRIDQLKDLVARKQEVLQAVKSIAAHGSVSQFKVIDMGAQISELEARQQDLRVALAQAQQHLVEAMSAKAHIEFDNSLRTEQALATTADEIEDCKRSITSMRAVVQVLQDGPIPASPDHLNLKITRKTQGRFKVIPATEMTQLMPGDVLQVGPGRSAAPLPSRTTSAPQDLQN